MITGEQIRNAAWESIQPELRSMRYYVLAGWHQYGPCTTRDLARLSGLNLLSICPRTTELYQLGLLKLIGRWRGCGVYRPATREEWENHRRPSGQLELEPRPASDPF
jgi:hypothetical protein